MKLSVDSKKRKYTKLSPTTWAEIEALWQAGEVTLEELTERFSVSRRALQLHFKKTGVAKGEKAAALAAAIRDEVLKEELDDKDLIIHRAKEIRETGYKNAVAVEALILAQLKLAQEDPSQALKASSAVKMLSLAAAGLERLHDLKKRSLGLDRDGALGEELPVLVIEDLTTERIDQMRAQQAENELCDDMVGATAALLVPRQNEKNEVVFVGDDETE
jgi:hypothetical protein